MCVDQPRIEPNIAQNNNTTRYISADEIANGARAFNDAAHTNTATSDVIPITFVGRANNIAQPAIARTISSRTPEGDENASNTDHRPG